MSSGSSAPAATRPLAVSGIGQRRHVAIPKRVFEALQLQEGDFVEVSVEGARIEMRPKRLVDVDESLTAREAAKVRRGEAQLRAGCSRPWRAVKHDLGLPG